MRICYLGDANVQVRRVAEYFISAGDDVHVVTARPASIPGAQVHSFAGPLARGRGAFLLGLPEARRLVTSLRPDLVHVFYATSYGLVASMIPGPPVALSPMGSDVLVSARSSRLMSFMVRRAIARADVIFSVAPHMTSALVALGAPADRVHTFPRGVDLERFPFSPTRGTGGRPVILSNRRLEAVYNIEQLVRAAPAVLRRYPDVVFQVFGEGSLRRDLEALAKTLGLSASVRFLGVVDHDLVPSTLREADLYVSCSRSDGTSVSLLEAMAAGLYPVVSDIEANRSWITHGANGSLFPLDDSDALSSALSAALASRESLGDLLRANRALVEERASWSSNMHRMRAVYNRLVQTA
ncbi:MAG TPA: glycosyltransferase family 4 protein [Candidatus Polarisedimenticolia bacterium]|jgi:glycosyltransferase involved in cell wall biosynthesis